ncbi:hypothetical protein SNE40_001260 [Patella caerulea]|uniref:ShKT domain-containing protein n=1 Tax=Patella caerulea TaxID=87958 RepID=A0AAN8KIA5_PATCE
MVALLQAVRCRVCSGVASPQFCVQTMQCQPDEECFTERVVGDDDNIFFNSGCLKKGVCAILAQMPSKRSSLQLCDGCCPDDLCNTYICEWPASYNRSECYECDGIKNPRDCRKKVLCEEDELCYTGEYYTENNELLFRVGCETKRRCEILDNFGKKRAPEIQVCNECCVKSGCNRHLCPRPNVSSTATPAPSVASSQSSQPPMGSTASMVPTASIVPTDSTVSTGSIAPTISSCVDGILDCQELQNRLHICNTITQATRKYCPKFCKLC